VGRAVAADLDLNAPLKNILSKSGQQSTNCTKVIPRCALTSRLHVFRAIPSRHCKCARLFATSVAWLGWEHSREVRLMTIKSGQFNSITRFFEFGRNHSKPLKVNPR
jgi:hypothetical protein